MAQRPAARVSSRVVVHDGSGVQQFFMLRHPRTDAPTLFARSADKLLQVQSVTLTEPSSWLFAAPEGGAESVYADQVEHDGRLHVATPVDPVFLVLGQLLAARGELTDERPKGVFRPLSDCIVNDHERVLELPRLVERLRAVCDLNELYDEPMLRLSDEKLLKWMRAKTDAVEKHLGAKASAAAASATASELAQFDAEPEIVPAGGQTRSRAKQRLDALALVCEYLPTPLHAVLLGSYGLSADALAARAEPAPTDGAPGGSQFDEEFCSAGVGYSGGGPLAPLPEQRGGGSEPAPKKQKAAPVKKVVPLGKGQKKMMSFFTKK